MILPDVNLLVALSDAEHDDHAKAKAWSKGKRLTTCPITELGLVRVSMQLGASAEDALKQLTDLKVDADFIPCDAPAEVLAGKVTGHRQTTDVYLGELAKAHKGKLYTLDGGIKGAEPVS